MSGNTEVIQGAYDAFAKADIPAVLGAFDPNIEWTEPDGLPYAGTYNGPDAVLQGVFMKIGTDWDGFTVVPSELVDGGDTVVALGTLSGTYKATGKAVRAPFAHVWKLRDGKAIKFHQYTNTAIVQEALTA
jgi:ketosteroid isomerase-like protein